MPCAFIELRSSRLVLRRLRPEEAPALCAYRSLPEVARFQSWESFGADDAAQLIAKQAEREPNIPGDWFQLAIVLAHAGTLIGDCGLHFRDDDPRQVEVGITLDPAHQRQGFATEALGAVLRYLFDSLGKHRVSAVTDAENAAAIRLMLRTGFKEVSHEPVWFKGRWGSEKTFALHKLECESLD